LVYSWTQSAGKDISLATAEERTGGAALLLAVEIKTPRPLGLADDQCPGAAPHTGTTCCSMGLFEQTSQRVGAALCCWPNCEIAGESNVKVLQKESQNAAFEGKKHTVAYVARLRSFAVT
jgi:hypothetical protein